MTANTPVRAATVPELAYFRGEGQWSRLNLAIHAPATVYTARVNQDFSTSGVDNVVQVTYDTGSGTLADVLPGMTLWVGSSAGAKDKGVARIRVAPDATDFFIGAVSHIQFADDDYLTVVDEFRLWQRDIRNAGNAVYMDYDINYGNYQNGGAIVRAGPIAAVVHIDALTEVATFTPPSPALSECYDGATISSWLYEAPGASSTSNMTDGTGLATWEYDTVGTYRWSLTVTDSEARTTTVHRWVFVDPAAQVFSLESCDADYQSGDWSFSVTGFSGVTLADVNDGALCVLYAEEEYYGADAVMVGRLAGYENILAVGWIAGESIARDPESGEVAFTVYGPARWLAKMRAFPFELTSTTGTPANWKQIQDMTVDKALAHILQYTTTAPTVMDCFFTGDTTVIKVITQPAGNLLGQLNAIALNTIFAKPLVNSLGQMFVEIDPQVADSTARALITTVMDITAEDYIGRLDIERNTTDKAAQVELGAVADYSGSTPLNVYSRAPGGTPKTTGDFKSYNNYIVPDQDECNRIAGALLALENPLYEPLEIAFAANNRLFDICPRMYATFSLAANETPRGITISAANLIPRRVGYEWDGKVLLTKAVFEFETTGVDGVTYIPPKGDSTPTYGIDDMGDVDFPSSDLGSFFPPVVPTDTVPPCSDPSDNVSARLTWDVSELKGYDPDQQLIARVYYPCIVRATGSAVRIYGDFFGDSGSEFSAFAIKGGSRVLSASSIAPTSSASGYTAYFSPVSNTEVDGFEIELNAGIGSPVTYEPGVLIDSGSIDVNASNGVATATVTVNEFYSIEATGGYWRPSPIAIPDQQAYDFAFSLNGGTNWSASAPGLGNRRENTPPYDWVYRWVANGADATEDVDGDHGRAYIQATTVNLRVRVASDLGSFANNDGSLGYILREAIVNGRRIELDSGAIANVCRIGT